MRAAATLVFRDNGDDNDDYVEDNDDDVNDEDDDDNNDDNDDNDIGVNEPGNNPLVFTRKRIKFICLFFLRPCFFLPGNRTNSICLKTKLSI